jgi:hypothetical protein
MAATARTVPLETTEHFAALVDDLRTRLDAAGRDPASVDISFACHAGGDPASDAFDADAHLEGLAELAKLGVTWVQVGLPGDDLTRTLETIQRYGQEVIDALA